MRRIASTLRLFGVDVAGLRDALVSMPQYLADYVRFRKLANHPIPLGRLYPCLHDRHLSAGQVGGHYFHQDLYFAKKIYETRPTRHVDVGSRLDGFVAHLLVFCKVEVIDIRPIDTSVENLTFRQGDASEMSPYADGELESISCLHAAEHFGLGRYGDPLDARGHERLIASLLRAAAPAGHVYFSVPVSGRERVEFNAHRVFDPQTVINLFSSGATLKDFALVDDGGQLVQEATIAVARKQVFGCGLFTFERK